MKRLLESNRRKTLDVCIAHGPFYESLQQYQLEVILIEKVYSG